MHQLSSRFQPGSPLLRSAHIQTLFASSGYRSRRVQKLARRFLANTRREVIFCKDNVRLEAWVTRQPGSVSANPPLVIIIHGWLGSADSSYVIDAGQQLYTEGFSIARLNLRDHGETHHLNTQVFHSARIHEALDACLHLMQGSADQKCTLLGFSLGGNFALRISALLGTHSKLNGTIAVCPLVEPEIAMHAIDTGWFAYQWYFLKKWRSSMLKKQRIYTQYDYREALRLNSVSALTELFVKQSTPYENTAHYFQAYSIAGDLLDGLGTPSHIIAAKDDPIIPHTSFFQIACLGQRNSAIQIHMQTHGGHCGFIEDFACNSWLNTALLELLNDQNKRATQDTNQLHS